ncbi:MAG: SLC45 family MFS transporter [Chloroflexales bacterium]|nr:SLC45 family MFS transporter [Chloroflexales bacterium]
MTVREAPAPPFGALRQLGLAVFSFPYNFIWGGVGSIVLPLQIAAIVGEAQKELYTGVIPVLAAVLSTLIGPVVGARSDRSRSPLGRRRPHIVGGALAAALVLPLMAGFGTGSNVLVYAVLVAGLGVTTSWAKGAYTALFADVVPEERRGAASGWQGVLGSLGLLCGLLVAGQLAAVAGFGPIYLVTTAVLLVGLVLTVVAVREPPASARAQGRARPFQMMIPPYHTHRDFYWTLFTRGFNTMGIFTFYTFVPFFMADVVRVPDAPRQASYFLAILLVAGLPTALLGGMLADRYGRKRLVVLSGGMMALGAALLVPLCFFPSPPLIFACAMIIGAGSGAFQAVDWALVLDVLPDMADAGKDLNIWTASRILPQSIAPLLSGLLLNALKPISLGLGYALLWGVAALWFSLTILFIGKVRGSR